MMYSLRLVTIRLPLLRHVAVRYLWVAHPRFAGLASFARRPTPFHGHVSFGSICLHERFNYRSLTNRALTTKLMGGDDEHEDHLGSDRKR